MNILFSILQQASSLMPNGIPARTSGRLLTALLFFKIISDLRNRDAEHNDAANRAMRIVIPTNCTYSTCLSTTSSNTAAAIHEALLRLVSLQPHGALNDVFFPEEFIQLGRIFHVTGDTKGLSSIVQLIGSLNFYTFSPSPALAALFSAACHACHCGPRPFIAEAAPLMAQLLQPAGGERVLDPLCGQGTLLTACAALLAQRAPDAALGLYGMEEGASDFAIAKMRCYLAGLPTVRLKKTDVLTAPQRRRGQFGLVKADIVITALPDHAKAWHHALAFAERDKRFPVRPPADSRVAWFWHSLFYLKTSGRMAVLVPPELLECHDSFALRRHLIEKNLLEAVITLPEVRWSLTPKASAAPLLLLIHRNKPHPTVAFITPGGARKHQQSGIVNAYHDSRLPHFSRQKNLFFP